ncbi:flavodoxin family protein [Desulfocurvus sp. DL9XJH121]
MKVLGICGSPRKKGNTATLMEHALKGAADKGADIRLAHLYGYEFKGCVSCYSCKKPGGAHYGRCAARDGLSPLLEEAMAADALVLGSPVFYGGQSGVMRCFLERLLYPLYPFSDHKTLGSRPIPSLFIYTMGGPRAQAEKDSYFEGIDLMTRWLEQLLLAPSKVLMRCATMHQDDYTPFGPLRFDVEARRRDFVETFPRDCLEAESMGASLIGEAHLP